GWVGAVRGSWEAGAAPGGAAPFRGGRGPTRPPLRGRGGTPRPAAPGGAGARRYRVLARPHAVEPQPGENGECGERPCFPHGYARTRRVGTDSPTLYAALRT